MLDSLQKQGGLKGLPWDKVAIVGLLMYCLFPILWLMKLSMMKGGFTNYVDVLSEPTFLKAFMNSVIVSGSATAIAMVIGGFAGYSLARLPVPGKDYILFAVLAVSMFPPISIIGPLFDLWRDLGLFDTKLGLIIPHVTFALPMSIWIMASFFKELPRDLEHAAYMDGATPFQAFRQIMLPLAAPGVFTAAILVFIHSWNELLLAITLTADKSMTVTAAISRFQGKDSLEIPVGQISAASIVIMLPLLVLVLVFQRRIVGGLTAGGVKG